MCNKNPQKLSSDDDANIEEMESLTSSDSDSFDEDAVSTDEDESINRGPATSNQIQAEDSDPDLDQDNNLEEEEEEEEDSVIKAIKRERDRKNDHPSTIKCDDFITDISFHPYENILAIANIVGDVLFYKYSNEENVLLSSMEVHTKACRDIEFSHDGKMLYSVSKDKSIMINDIESRKLVQFYENAHEVPIYCLTVIDENLFATGDDDGTIKLWDRRQKTEQIYKTKKNEDYISDIVTNGSHKYLLCSSGDGSLTTLDLENRKVHMQSEEYEEELTCLGLFRTETKLLAGTSKGRLLLYNWNEFGLHSDIFPGPKTAVNDLIPVTENIVVTACEDGHLRATHLFPHRHLGIVGQHELPIENVDICNDGTLIASSSHDNDIKFWNIQYFEDFEKVSSKHKKHETKKEMAKHLPSSKVKNVSDFFSDM